MRIIQPTEKPRLNEPVGFVLLVLAIGLTLSLVSYTPFDPSWNVVGFADVPRNLIGVPGAYLSDVLLQSFGLGAFLLPLFLMSLGWWWIRSKEVVMPLGRLFGAVVLLVVSCTALSLYPMKEAWRETISSGGLVGRVLAEVAVLYLNEVGTILVLSACAIVSLYLLTSFHLASAGPWVAESRGSLSGIKTRWAAWRQRRRKRKSKDPAERPRRRIMIERRPQEIVEDEVDPEAYEPYTDESDEFAEEESAALPPIIPYDAESDGGEPAGEEGDVYAEDPFFSRAEESRGPLRAQKRTYHLPSTLLLQPPAQRGDYDPEELHDVAQQICTKFEEFGVGGKVTQINPGPVVTTFEFKPNPGIKYTKIVNLSEDLCLALECESVMVERIPGKSTVGIEVPNRKREVIALREMIESPEFTESSSLVTMTLGKDINGRMRVADLSSMPHLLIAGSTGAGKSVLVNSIVMSILFKADPDQVRFIMVDPKTVELGLYVDIPHLLTPVITDMKKASNALKNATREMERRLKLLAEFSVRNLDQYNRKVAKLTSESAGALVEEGAPPRPLPYIVIIIDELADLMMLEGRQIEESITRLAQMARAVGIHLILATQRPSVDVITGLIKANIPSRISFRLATRVDSRTILDSMGAESLLGRGDMLFLPPGSGRMVRLHGPFVNEDEIEAVARAWKDQGEPDYENAFLAPPEDEAEADGADAEGGFDDPAYEDAVRIVLEMGKASTSTLQRRLRLGYGRAARILDAMERDGIIGPPDGSRAREVLKRPDWLVEVEP
jgi:S-DNA-T family DNA segregation ATPase FtsK/SpoIIIE